MVKKIHIERVGGDVPRIVPHIVVAIGAHMLVDADHVIVNGIAYKGRRCGEKTDANYDFRVAIVADSRRPLKYEEEQGLIRILKSAVGGGLDPSEIHSKPGAVKNIEWLRGVMEIYKATLGEDIRVKCIGQNGNNEAYC